MIGNKRIGIVSVCLVFLPPFLRFRQMGEVDRYNVVF